MTGGTVTVYGPTANNNGALDVDSTFNITGGKLLAVGSSGMAVAPATSSSQVSLMINTSTSYAAGKAVKITDASGKVVAAFSSTKQFSSVVFSSSAIKKGTTYYLYVAGTKVGSAVGGTYTNMGFGGPGAGGGPGGQRP